MRRYVVLESDSGNLYGDTGKAAAMAGANMGAADAALQIDRARGRAKRGFGFVRQGSMCAALDVYLISGNAAVSAPTAQTTEDAKSLVGAHGEFVTSLVSYNS